MSPSSNGSDGDVGLVRIFDTTLRDGEQSPGCTMTRPEKLEVAHQLASMGVDIIEAGYPAASPGDANSVRAVAEEVGGGHGPVICGLARATEHDVRTCAAAVAPAARNRIHIFLATSDIHLEHKLRCSRDEVLRRGREAVSLAKTLVHEVEFSPEDAARTDPEYLLDVLAAVIECGATTLNIPDTVGFTTPWEYEDDDPPRRARWPHSIRASSCPRTVTTISASPWRTRSPASARARGRWRSRSTASVSGRATRRSRKW